MIDNVDREVARLLISALMPSAEELADAVAETTEEITGAEALQVGYMARRQALEIVYAEFGLLEIGEGASVAYEQAQAETEAMEKRGS